MPDTVRSAMVGLYIPFDKSIQGDLTALRAIGFTTSDPGHVLKTKDLANALQTAEKEEACQFLCHVPDKYFWIPARICDLVDTQEKESS